MAWDEEDDSTIYKVVVNHEEQYAVWPMGRKNPSGWRDAGSQGTKQICVDYVNKKGPGMRPLRLLK